MDNNNKERHQDSANKRSCFQSGTYQVSAYQTVRKMKHTHWNYN